MELIRNYFPNLTTDQDNKLSALKVLYTEWNNKINVISRKDMDQFYCNHVLHSLSIAKIHSFKVNENVLDIGTGGGFPGIPLAIIFPETKFHLVDSIQKKISVVSEVTNSLELKNVSITNDRFEHIKKKHDTIISRAVAPAIKLVRLTKNSTSKNSQHIFLKGGDLVDEKKELLQKYKTLKWNESRLSYFFSEAFFETKKVIKLNY
ncbi:MAG: 16S rRNA (guanine(527)-N(7))-methyltransferase RsmG [Bacteroidia bacterium]|nr:16S rRNA (guanine(527)-N(7))-methyltransferase RsmG [Bacteroidia bacterium]